jgi:hypothetical protein
VVRATDGVAKQKKNGKSLLSLTVAKRKRLPERLGFVGGLVQFAVVELHIGVEIGGINDLEGKERRHVQEY